MFSAHSCKKNWKNNLSPARRPCAPWRRVLDGPPAARALSPIARLIATAGRDKGCDIGLIFPRRRRERYEAARRGPLPPRPFSFPLPACKSHSSLSPEPSGAAARQKKVREKHLEESRGGKRERGIKPSEKKRGRKTYQERARGKRPAEKRRKT